MNFRLIRLLAALTVAVTALCTIGGNAAFAAGAGTKGTIDGFVTMEGSDLAFAQVTLHNSSGQLVTSTFSTASGFHFSNLNPGTYTVTAIGPYGNDAATVSVAKGQTVHVDLTLPNPSPGTIGIPAPPPEPMPYPGPGDPPPEEA